MSGKRYKLKFTPKASEDLEQIFSYITGSLMAEIAADNLLEKIEISIMRLESFPYSGSFIVDEPLKNRGYRKLIIGNLSIGRNCEAVSTHRCNEAGDVFSPRYIAFYLVNEQEKQVVIMRILYGAQNYQDIL
ncbi:MAG: type II toxin-antitoxin system RelE/ParE family toxin [Syntrophomonadaceae bacterium]|nr:type II toxin-antitoxin system RelE/ParE family toxin [Syntrophomonadaceae bacterium]